jgi:hypothetical protein
MEILQVPLVVTCMFTMIQVIQAFQSRSHLNHVIQQLGQETGDAFRRAQQWLLLMDG